MNFQAWAAHNKSGESGGTGFPADGVVPQSVTEALETNLAHLSAPSTLEKAQHQYLERGFYADQLERYERYFNRSRIYVEVSEAIRETLDYRGIYKFLGVRAFHDSSAHEVRIGERSQLNSLVIQNMTLHFETHARLQRLFAPHNERLCRWMQKSSPCRNIPWANCMCDPKLVSNVLESNYSELSSRTKKERRRKSKRPSAHVSEEQATAKSQGVGDDLRTAYLKLSNHKQRRKSSKGKASKSTNQAKGRNGRGKESPRSPLDFASAIIRR